VWSLGDRSFSFYNLLLLPVIQVFAKAPSPGRVKTRLLGRLTPQQAASLHWALVADTLDTTAQLASSADVEIHTDVPTDAWAAWQVPSKVQAAGDLGERMRRAIGSALRSGRPKALIVGGDIPDLPHSHVAALLDSSADVTLGPAEDGGFYAISCRGVHPRMFEGVHWSTGRTLEQTVQALDRCGLTVHVSSPWRDLDTPDDLDRLIEHSHLPAHVSLWLNRLRNADPGSQRPIG
jgi:uncharacterized protein